mmetsp:Transcript_89477/g.154974  ORF Transcript_89477/g.154974 Transcript_89477/m.154974 type:complete len:89 (-) Transcript_89477:737-1003(-)
MEDFQNGRLAKMENLYGGAVGPLPASWAKREPSLNPPPLGLLDASVSARINTPTLLLSLVLSWQKPTQALSIHRTTTKREVQYATAVG